MRDESTHATTHATHVPEGACATLEVEMYIKATLLERDAVAAAPIKVRYDSGVVPLTGFVGTAAERDRAAAIACDTAPRVRISTSPGISAALIADATCAGAASSS